MIAYLEREMLVFLASISVSSKTLARVMSMSRKWAMMIFKAMSMCILIPCTARGVWTTTASITDTQHHPRKSNLLETKQGSGSLL
jgi:hypothetical protein